MKARLDETMKLTKAKLDDLLFFWIIKCWKEYVEKVAMISEVGYFYEGVFRFRLDAIFHNKE